MGRRMLILLSAWAMFGALAGALSGSSATFILTPILAGAVSYSTAMSLARRSVNFTRASAYATTASVAIPALLAASFWTGFAIGLAPRGTVSLMAAVELLVYALVTAYLGLFLAVPAGILGIATGRVKARSVVA